MFIVTNPTIEQNLSGIDFDQPSGQNKDFDQPSGQNKDEVGTNFGHLLQRVLIKDLSLK